MSRTNVNRLYGRSVYLKVAVPQTQEVNVNITYFRKAIILIGEGHEGKGRKKIQEQTNCTGNEIRRIYKLISSYANYRFVQKNTDVLGIDDYYSCIRLSLDRFDTIVKYILSELEKADQTEVFKKYLELHPTYNQTVFQTMFHEMLASWKAMNFNADICNQYNKHIRDDAHQISNNMYNNVKHL